MSGTGRKRISKWDLKEEPQLLPADIHDNAGPGKAGNLVQNLESQPGWHSPEIAVDKDPKWYVAEANDKDCREFSDATMAWDGDVSYSTKMSPGLDDWRQQKRNRSPKSGGGRSYRSRSRSRSRSPPYFKRDPVSNDKSTVVQPCKDFSAGRCRRGDNCPYLHHGDRDSEGRRYAEGAVTDSWEGRPRRVGASKYYASDDTREQPPRTGRSSNPCFDFVKGKCFKGASCKYVHHSAASDGFGKGSANEIFKDREDNGRNRGAAFDHGRNQEPRRSGDIPCKFFAAGNCRNGKFCRFSHHSQRRDSPDDRSRDEWRRRSNNEGNVEQVRDGVKWSDKTASNVAELPEWNGDINGNMGVPAERATTWSIDDRWEPSVDTNNTSLVHPTDGDQAVGSCEREYIQLKAENTCAGIDVSEAGVAENWLGDMEISSPWNSSLPSSNHIVKEEPCHITQTSQSLTLEETALKTCQQDITQEVSQKHHTVGAVQPLISQNSFFQSNRRLVESAADALSCEDRKATSDTAMSHIDLNFCASAPPRQNLEQNVQSSITATLYGLNTVGQNQQRFAPYVPREEFITNTHNQQLFQEVKSFSKPDVWDANRLEVINEIPCSQNVASREQLSQLSNLSASSAVWDTNRPDVVSSFPSSQNIANREQLSQLSNLSASLAQLFGTGQHLPQLYAALNGSNSMGCMPSSLSNSAGPVALPAAASSQPNPAIQSEKQNNPTSDSCELTKPDISNRGEGFAPNSVEGKSTSDGKAEIPPQTLIQSSVTGGSSDDDLYRIDNLEVELDHKSHQLNKPDPVANCEGEENDGTAAQESKKGQDSNTMEKIGDGKADESKKNNDGKAIRAFKFALVEFVKELLKPKWKEGQISKEAHKTIVKKVVDKVTGSIQGVNVPQSQEKIDTYLSSSKPKLSKLVQAYVEKYQKS